SGRIQSLGRCVTELVAVRAYSRACGVSLWRGRAYSKSVWRCANRLGPNTELVAVCN
ncbi:hypothetical protein L9F63_001986, partial [Diploptera punctata]